MQNKQKKQSEPLPTPVKAAAIGESESGKKAVKTVILMILAMVFSKGLGLFRTTLLASNYGTGDAAVAFTAASRIPLSFFDMLFGAAILGCLVPVYNSFKSKDNTFDDESKRRADDFACIFLNFIFLLTGVLSLIGILFAKPIISVLISGADPAVQLLAVKLVRILFPVVIFTGGTYTLIGVMQSKERFLLPSMISCISNLFVILYFLFVDDWLGENSIFGLACAYLIAWLLQLLTLVVPLLRMGFRFRLLLNLRDPSLRRAIKMTPPIMIGSWLAPVGTLTATHFAVGNAVTVFEYSNNMYVIIVGILTYGICNFTFPKLARMNVLGDEKAFCSMAKTGLLSTFAMILPIMAGVIILSGEGTALLYFRDKFTAHDTMQTAYALRLLAVGMPAYCTIEMVNRIMYSKMSVYVPMLGAMTGIICNIVLTVLLKNNTDLGVGALTLANAIGQYAAAILLTVFLLRRVRGILSKDFFFNLCKIMLLTLAVTALMLLLYRLIGNHPYEASVSMLHNAAVAVCVFAPAAVCYLLGLKLLRIRFSAL